MRRLRAALTGLAESIANADRAETVKKFLLHLDRAIERSPFDAQDRAMVHREGRQGIGLFGRAHRDRDRGSAGDGDTVVAKGASRCQRGLG